MEQQMLSLFDYLKSPAGGELGKKVYETAKKCNIKTSIREIKTKSYQGKIVLYPKSFLDIYFNTTFHN